MILNDSDNDQLMALAAFRYCLGRQSYIVGACHQWLRGIWPQLTNNTRHVVVRDIIEALHRECAGDAVIDAPGWLGIAKWGAAQMTDEQRAELRRSCLWLQSAVTEKVLG